MDLYKHAFRLTPMIPSDLTADCFRLSGLWIDDEEFVPVAIETAEGKRQYAEMQRGFSERATPLRAEFLRWCDEFLAMAVRETSPASA